MSLNLGRIPFSPDRPPWARRRRAGKQSARPVDAATDPPLEVAAGAPDAASGSRLAELTIRPPAFGPLDVRFLVGATEDRMGRALTASLVSHIVGGALLALIISLTPAPVFELIIPNRESYSIVWIPEEGPGGGGGGGGNESLEPAPPLEVAGADETPLSVPVQEEPDFVEPEVEPEPEVLETQEMNIPAVSMAAAPQTRSGVLDDLAADAAGAQGSGSGGGGGTGEGTGSGSGTGPGLGPGEGGGVGGGVYRPGAGIVNPRLLREVRPQYTAEALRAKITGTVYLEMVVLADGTVGDVRITRSLDPVFGLDEEAIKAAREWLFEPGTRFGEPVAILVNLALDFNLR